MDDLPPSGGRHEKRALALRSSMGSSCRRLMDVRRLGESGLTRGGLLGGGGGGGELDLDAVIVAALAGWSY